MPKIDPDFKRAVGELTNAQLQQIVLELARQNKESYDYINLKYFSSEESLKEFFEEVKDDALFELIGVYSRGIVQKNLAKAIGNAVKHINYFEKITKNDAMVAELLLALLEEVYDDYSDELGTCFTVFDSKLAITTNRLYNLVTKKLHPDYQIEYRKPLNRFLKILKEKSSQTDYIFAMPKSIPD